MQYTSEKKSEKDNKDGKDHLNNTECMLIINNYFNFISQVTCMYIYSQ